MPAPKLYAVFVTGPIIPKNTPAAKANIIPELNAMTGLVGDVLVWGLVDEDQTPSYSPVDESQSPSYTTVTDTQSPDWDEVAA